MWCSQEDGYATFCLYWRALNIDRFCWHSKAQALERDLEEVGEELREESEGKQAAIADLHNVVEEITAEEDRLLDEIELLKSVDSNRVITFRRTERELKYVETTTVTTVHHNSAREH